MKQEYTTGRFARKCQVSERALRLYDKKGLLRPRTDPENGYRYYQETDMITLQKILMLKKLGFSLEEIAVLLARDDKSVIEALQEQRSLVQQKIQEYKTLDDALRKAIVQVQINEQSDWYSDALASLHRSSQLVEQYKNADNLNVRISLHDKYSKNPVSWFPWLFSQISFHGVNRLLEVGCGSGELWKSCPISLRQREIFLSDISAGMIGAARENLKEKDFSFMVFDLNQIPFRDAYFDAVCANHVLFYLENVEAGLAEIARVLKPGGTLYASAYGPHHMQEITALAREFDPSITLSDVPLYEVFGTENGKALLEQYFQEVEYIPYSDSLLVSDPRDLADYILSCHGNQNEKIMPRYEAFLDFLQKRLSTPLYVTKEVGVFCARHPYLP